jgi:hypothetical protein
LKNKNQRPIDPDRILDRDHDRVSNFPGRVRLIRIEPGQTIVYWGQKARITIVIKIRIARTK